MSLVLMDAVFAASTCPLADIPSEALVDGRASTTDTGVSRFSPAPSGAPPEQPAIESEAAMASIEKKKCKGFI
jgi:hypothetical protein